MALIQRVSAGAFFAAAIMLALSSFASGQENNAPETVETSQAQKSEQGLAPPPSVIIAEPSLDGPKAVEIDWRKPSCDEPKSHNEADLCEQRHMAEAAKDTVFLNKVQIGIGVLTIIGLIFTVYYTGRTAKAAILAADAAKEAADHVPNVERAYIYGGFGARDYSFAPDGSWLIRAQPTMANYERHLGSYGALRSGRVG